MLYIAKDGRTLAVFFSVLLSLWTHQVHATDTPVTSITVASSSTTQMEPLTRQNLCHNLLTALNRTEKGSGEAHPIYDYFSTLNLILSNSSYSSFDARLSEYKSLGSLWQTVYSIRHNEVSGKGERHRRQLVIQFYDMFEKAAQIQNDKPLATLLWNIYWINREITNALFFAGFSSDDRRDIEFLRSYLNQNISIDYEEALRQILVAWTALAPVTRANMLEWIGQVFSEGVNTYVQTTFRFTSTPSPGGAVRPDVSHRMLLPELKETLEQYLSAHRGEGSKSELTKNYYRSVALKMLKFYGIYGDALALPPSAEVGILQKVQGLLGVLKAKD